MVIRDFTGDSEVKNDIIVLNLFHNGNHRIKAYATNNKEDAFKIAKQIAERLKINLWTPGIYRQKMLPAHIKNYRFKPNYRYLMILFPPVLKGSADVDVRFLSESLKPPK